MISLLAASVAAAAFFFTLCTTTGCPVVEHQAGGNFKVHFKACEHK